MVSEKKINQWLDSKLIKRQEKSLKQIRNLLSRALKDIKTAEENVPIDEEAVYTFAYLSMLRAGRASIKQQWNLRAWSWVRDIAR